jgi:3-deoxy-D-manno-octulosonic-acid transferase
MAIGDVREVGIGRVDGVHYLDTGMYDVAEYGTVYLVEADRPAVVDTGIGTDYERVRRALGAVGIDPPDLGAIALTHVHLDHAGGAGFLVEDYPNADVYVHRIGAPYVVDPDPLVAGTKRAVGEQWAYYTDPRPVPEDRVVGLEDGDAVDLGDRQLLAHHAPGHAPHQVVYEDPEAGAVYTGDAAGLWAPSTGEVLPTSPPPNFDLETALADVEMLADLDPEVLCYGHFGPAAPDDRLGTYAGRLEAWAAASRRSDLPLLWIHGASVGELMGAAPVVRSLRTAGTLQLAVTFSSPSAERSAGALDPDVAEFVPLDTLRDTKRALRALRPACLVYAKGDVWPGLTGSAHRAGVPIALVNATVQEGSSRLRGPARSLLSSAYGRLDAVGAATRDDAERLERLGVRPDRIRVTGDAALDEALGRMARAEDGDARRRLRQWRPADVPVLLAGSTWPPDEEVLLEATAALRREGRDVTLVLVPHEPTGAAVDRLRGRAREVLGVGADVWSDVEGPSSGGVLVVDVVGILAELYPEADLAYVGGGFGEDGLHSVVEPAAAGRPVLFGPVHRRWEARRLLDRGGAESVDGESAARLLGDLLASPDRRSSMGRECRRFVEEGAGAAEAGAELVAELMREDPPRG